MGGVILAVIEGVAALMMRSTSKTPREQQLEMLQMEQAQQDWAKQQQQQATNGTPEQVFYIFFCGKRIEKKNLFKMIMIRKTYLKKLI